MASWQPPVDPDNKKEDRTVLRRLVPDLPDHILGTVVWKTTYEVRGLPGYYQYNPDDDTTEPVEFLDNNWFWLHYNIFSNTFSTREDSRIKVNDCHTGYWHITDPEHSDYTPPTPSSHSYKSRADTLKRAASPPTPSTSTRFPVPGESDNEEQEQKPLPAPQPRASTSKAHLRTETPERSKANTPHRDYDEFIRAR